MSDGIWHEKSILCHQSTKKNPTKKKPTKNPKGDLEVADIEAEKL